MLIKIVYFYSPIYQYFNIIRLLIFWGYNTHKYFVIFIWLWWTLLTYSFFYAFSIYIHKFSLHISPSRGFTMCFVEILAWATTWSTWWPKSCICILWVVFYISSIKKLSGYFRNIDRTTSDIFLLWANFSFFYLSETFL